MNLLNVKKNAPEYTVSGITEAIREVIYQNFSIVKIRGEVAGLKISSKGHVYFSLKDDKSSINAVCFASNFKKLKVSLTDGAEVIAFGEIDTFGSGYQLKVESVEYAGVGALMKLMEERKQKLAKMGIFDAQHKKAIPQSFEIENIGIITSATGAVIQDIINRVNERYPKNILLFNAMVQGLEAPEQVVAGINYFNNISNIKPEVIIIARGGGSVEDLFCFNDEGIAMSVFESKIPIISAIGHEVDTTIIDFVSDLRAATPTAAAEIVTTPTATEISSHILQNRSKIGRIAEARHKYYAEKTLFIKQRLMQTKNGILSYNNQINILHQRLIRSVDNAIFGFYHKKNDAGKILFRAKDMAIKKIDKYIGILKKSEKVITLFAQNIFNKINTLKNKMTVSIWRKHDMVNSALAGLQKDFLQSGIGAVEKNDRVLSKLKQSMSYLDYHKNLKKGYAIILDQDKKITKNKMQFEQSSHVVIKMYDGDIEIDK